MSDTVEQAKAALDDLAAVRRTIAKSGGVVSTNHSPESLAIHTAQETIFAAVPDLVAEVESLRATLTRVRELLHSASDHWRVSVGSVLLLDAIHTALADLDDTPTVEQAAPIDIHVVRDGARIIGAFASLPDAELERDEYPKRAGIPGTNLPMLIRERTTIESHKLQPIATRQAAPNDHR